MPVDKINDFLVKGGNQNDIRSVLTLRDKIRTATILNTNDIDTLDDKYTIVKDYGPGSFTDFRLLNRFCVYSSIKKFLKKKGDFLIFRKEVLV